LNDSSQAHQVIQGSKRWLGLYQNEGNGQLSELSENLRRSSVGRPFI
jgi:hypothetical protein